MGLNIKLIHILSVFILGAAYSSLVSASAEIISTDSFCPKCNLYSHRANGIDLLVMASPNTEAPDDFLNRIDNIAVYTDRILRHPFFKSTFTTNFSEIGILLDYEKRITGGFYFPQLKTKNFGPVIVVNPDAILINQDMYYLLAHELTHLFHYS